MTNEQKIQVVTLRAAGLSYAKIGERLGVSKDTVKTYARRHPVKEKMPACITGACRNCGIKIEQLPGRKKRISARTNAEEHGGTRTLSK